MKFNKLVLDKLGLFFQEAKLQVIDQWENYIKFKSESVIITLSYNARENAASFCAGKEGNSIYPINKTVAQVVFDSNLILTDTSPEILIDNLLQFFQKEGKSLLSGDITTLRALEECILKESKDYTNQLIEKQNLDQANKVWNDGNYIEFIKCIDKVDRQKLPPSYELKYKIALQKSKN